MIIAVSNKDSEAPFEGKIEFYHAFYSAVTDFPTIFKLKFEISVLHQSAFDSAQFEHGDFFWQPSPLKAPHLLRVCPSTHFLDSVTRLCQPCAWGHGTTDLMQSECMSCHQMWLIGQQNIFNPESSIELALAFRICEDPTSEPKQVRPIEDFAAANKASSSLNNSKDDSISPAALIVLIVVCWLACAIVCITYLVWHRKRKEK
mmetsp:Transcript_38539/g.50517  ORF Transcript_38539/g.50517 Transcript_38539/m.50517 type:complete len:203 (+) Transcript_38539:1039-1647(+)